MKKVKVSIFKVVLFESIVVWFLFDWFVFYFGDLFLSLRNFFSITRFACSPRFLSLYERTMFRSRQRDLFVLIFPLEGGRFGYWTCSRSLFQVGRFLFVSGAFASPKYDKCYSS